MRAPCGHPQATCIIGNFWNCPVCDAAPKPAVVSSATALREYNHNSQVNKSALAALAWERNGHRVEQVRGTGVLADQDLIAGLVHNACVDAAERLAASFGKIEDGAYGDCTEYITLQYGRGRAYRQKLREEICIPGHTTVDSAPSIVQAGVDRLVERIEAAVGAVREHQGWDDIKLWSLGPLPHPVVDDGRVAVRAATTDESVVWVRAFFVVLPK